MSVSCNPVIGTFNEKATCSCTLVDFDVVVEGLCNHTRYAMVVQLFCNGNLVATVCDIFNVNVEGPRCQCVNVRRQFRNIIADVQCCGDTQCTWSIDIPCQNYIIGCCAQVD